jgi:hypothetical protein
MAKEMTKYAVRKLIKAYFVTHRGREVSSKEIANWINDPNNNFGLKTRVDSKVITRMINHGRFNGGSILYDIEKTNAHPHKFMLK